ncbi:MAG: hypothetical protein JSR21_22165, partial [Proteobacteria bacterium]|nr:hypothetical protein [Pseudomonadota bacterium]
PDAFDPVTYRQVAQKNLTVLAVAPRMLTLPVTISAPRRIDKSVVVVAAAGGMLDPLSLERLGLKGFKPADGAAAEVGLALQPRCVEPNGPIGPAKLELKVPRGTSAGVHVAVRAPALRKGTYQLVTVSERSGDYVLGGLGLVLIASGEAEK